MNSRKAFTLIELLVVMAIILVLAGILLPVVSHMRRSAQITGQKADFVTISNALDQYKADFGDYPRNNTLPTWNTGNGPAPVFVSLATALLGPGPAVSQTLSNNTFEVGDGSDGLGFRCQVVNAIPGTVSLTASPPTFTPNPSYNNQAIALVNSSSSAQPILLQLSTYTSGAITYPAETVGVLGVALNGGSLPINLTLSSSPSNTGYMQAVLSVAGGKVWGPYVSADTFKVAFIPTTDVNSAAIPSAGEPVMLDRWGQVIQYFPRYGPANNRLNDSSLKSNFTGNPAVNSVQAGPLFGYSQPASIDNSGAGQNSIWDWRDAAPFFVTNPGPAPVWQNPVTGNSDSAYSWPPPPSGNPPYPNAFVPQLAIQWMLGDPTSLPLPSPLPFYNAIVPGDKINYDGPYILISTGPDGPERASGTSVGTFLSNGGYCTLLDSGGNVLSFNQFSQAFTNSGNIFNFDHP